MKKKQTLFCMILAAMLLMTASVSMADTDTKKDRPETIDADYAIMVEASTGNVMWSKNAYEKAYPASTTKLMTAILFYEEYQDKMHTIFTVGDEQDKLPYGSSLMGIEKGQKVTAEQLLYGLMLASGNDAALLMAESMGGFDNFVGLMNERAKTYGMNSTRFANPHGFTDENHYTTAADFAKLARQYYKNEYLMEVVKTESFSMTDIEGVEVTLTNPNRLLGIRPTDESYKLEQANGMKTGYTDAAGNCLVSSAKEGENNIILVTFKSSSSEVRFADAKKLLDYGLSNFSPVEIYKYIKDTGVSVDFRDIAMEEYEYGVFDTMVQVNSQEIVNMDKDLIKALNGESEQVTAKFNKSGEISYPIKEGDVIGEIEYFCGDQVIYSTKAVSSRYVTSRKIPTLFTTLRINQSENLDKKSYVEQMLLLGLELNRDRSKDNGNDTTTPQTVTTATVATTQATTTEATTTVMAQ